MNIIKGKVDLNEQKDMVKFYMHIYLKFLQLNL